MRFNWSLKVNVIGLLLVALFLRLSYWQYERHQWKLGYIDQMRNRLALEPVNLDVLLTQGSQPQELAYRRVRVAGDYDFSEEILIRNRKFKHAMGYHVLTPLSLEGSTYSILVNRGFIPLSKAPIEQRRAYQHPKSVNFVGLVKEAETHSFLAPVDPPNDKEHKLEAWLRPDISRIAAQLPFPVLPFYLEIMQIDDLVAVEQSIVDSSLSGRDEIMMMTPREGMMKLEDDDVGKGQYPIPVFDTVIPPGRHFGYIFEWAFMALLTIAICVVLQLRKGTIASQTR